MTEAAATRAFSWPRVWPWLSLVTAAVAMSATLPGRTHGLGVITTPLLADLKLTEDTYSLFNFWAVLLGTLLALPVGLAIDRFGTRLVATLVAAALGGAVLWMSRAGDATTLFLSLTATRGLGQTALSIVSMAIVGKWYTQDAGRPMAIYAMLLSIGSIVAFELLVFGVKGEGWRSAWAATGWALLFGLAPLCWLLVRQPGVVAAATAPVDEAASFTLGQVLRSPAFWAFGLATSFFNLVWSAITLYQRELLTEHGFDPKGNTYEALMGGLVVCGIISNLVSGWLAHRGVPLGRLLVGGLLLLAGSLIWFPHVMSEGQAIGYGILLGAASGPIIVVFFACWGQFFGRTNLAKVQGAAQALTVLASAAGPWLLTSSKPLFGTSAGFFQIAAGVAVLLAVVVTWVRVPTRTA